MIGKILGHYQITDKLGKGGMGVVYKARDIHLDRWVAIKVLPPEKVADPDRKRRFVQEAKAASALNHPNIVTIYDIDQADGIDFIAMEYIAGKTLDHRIGHRGIQLNDALRYAAQAADALAKAHSSGIIHRDLKPTNIMVNEDGAVKVLDFGLAKLTERVQGDVFASTVTEDIGGKPVTGKGCIVGTVAYMSPEQAEGKNVDARSDVFSLGSVMYEMVTGRRAFRGDSTVSTLAAILKKEPEPLGLGIPPDLEKVIARCLRKDPDRRFQAMGDLRVQLLELKEDSESGRSSTSSKSSPHHHIKVIWMALVLLIIGTICAAALWLLPRREAAEPALIPMPFTSYPGLEIFPTFSPDGSQVAFAWDGEKQENLDIYVKLIGTDPLRLTNDSAQDISPAWSPDGRAIAFVRYLGGANEAILLIPPIGGPERKLVEIVAPMYVNGPFLAWSKDCKKLVLVERDSPAAPNSLSVLSIDSGEKRKLTFPPSGMLGDDCPALSPDGRTLSFVRSQRWGRGDLFLLSLSPDLGATSDPKRLGSLNRSFAGQTWKADGSEIIASLGGVKHRLWRIPVSGEGTPSPLAFVGEDGMYPAISPSAHRLIYMRESWDANIWQVNDSGRADSPGTPRRLINSTQYDGSPEISPDGRKILYQSNRAGGYGLWVCDDDGKNALQLVRGTETGCARWSPDGQSIAFDSLTEGQSEVFVIASSGGKPRRLTTDPADDAAPSWSRNGRWIYFGSNRTGEYQIWKIPAEGGLAIQVTRKGGFCALETYDGTTLYYSKNRELPSLWKTPILGGDEIEIQPALNKWEQFALTSKGIYFVPRKGDRESSFLQFINLTGGPARNIATIDGAAIGSLSVSPDGRRILFSQIDQTISDLMLVENFR
jgi:eukaryotic-like serine/threonine-protein kinase